VEDQACSEAARTERGGWGYYVLKRIMKKWKNKIPSFAKIKKAARAAAAAWRKSNGKASVGKVIERIERGDKKKEEKHKAIKHAKAAVKKKLKLKLKCAKKVYCADIDEKGKDKGEKIKNGACALTGPDEADIMLLTPRVKCTHDPTCVARCVALHSKLRAKKLPSYSSGGPASPADAVAEKGHKEEAKEEKAVEHEESKDEKKAAGYASAAAAADDEKADAGGHSYGSAAANVLSPADVGLTEAEQKLNK